VQVEVESLCDWLIDMNDVPGSMSVGHKSRHEFPGLLLTAFGLEATHHI
jgi:hypothetical protein